tara:strand:+ start:130 stop:543 length:414 start_codon:yes stop_codon:yes gene_type:complete
MISQLKPILYGLKNNYFKNHKLTNYRVLSSININFINKQKKIQCKGEEGTTLLRVALDNDIPIEASCGGLQSCSTCHVYVDSEYIEKIPLADENEEDILDMVDDLKDTSRLACNIAITKDLDGITLTLPETVLNLQN